MRRRFSLAGLVLVALVGAAMPSRATDRSVYPSSPRQAPNEPVVPLEFTAGAETTLPGRPTGPPVPCGRDRWLAATGAGVTAISSSGETLWERPDLAGALLPRSCARFFGAADGAGHRLWLATPSPPALHALDGTTGRSVLTVDLPAEPLAGPEPFQDPLASTLALAGEVWVSLAGGALAGFDLADGAPEWAVDLPAETLVPPRAGRRHELFLVAGDRLVRVHTSSGTAETVRDLPAGATRPAARRGRDDKHVDLFIAAEDGRLYSYRCRSKKRGTRCKDRWSYLTGSRMSAPALLADGFVLAFSWDNFTYALSPDNGHLRWRRRASHRLTGPALPYRERVLLAPAASGGLAAFRIQDGTPSGQYGAGEDAVVLTPPAARGDEVAVMLQAGPEETVLRILGVREKPPEVPAAATDGATVSPAAP